MRVVKEDNVETIALDVIPIIPSRLLVEFISPEIILRKMAEHLFIAFTSTSPPASRSTDMQE